MRISDWSSDVCSSDLNGSRYALSITGKGCGSELVIGIKAAAGKACIPHASRPLAGQAAGRCRGSDMASGVDRYAANGVASGVILLGVLVSKWMRQSALCTNLPCEAGGAFAGEQDGNFPKEQIGRASCRERVCKDG